MQFLASKMVRMVKITSPQILTTQWKNLPNKIAALVFDPTGARNSPIHPLTVFGKSNQNTFFSKNMPLKLNPWPLPARLSSVWNYSK